MITTTKKQRYSIRDIISWIFVASLLIMVAFGIIYGRYFEHKIEIISSQTGIYFNTNNGECRLDQPKIYIKNIMQGDRCNFNVSVTLENNNPNLKVYFDTPSINEDGYNNTPNGWLSIVGDSIDVNVYSTKFDIMPYRVRYPIDLVIPKDASIGKYIAWFYVEENSTGNYKEGTASKIYINVKGE